LVHSSPKRGPQGIARGWTVDLHISGGWHKPYMVHFPFSPSADQLKLESDLDFIQNHITNAHQFALLNKRALRLFKTRWVPNGYAIVYFLPVSIEPLSLY
jgi:hypothetical protein